MHMFVCVCSHSFIIARIWLFIFQSVFIICGIQNAKRVCQSNKIRSLEIQMSAAKAAVEKWLWTKENVRHFSLMDLENTFHIYIFYFSHFTCMEIFQTIQSIWIMQCVVPSAKSMLAKRTFVVNVFVWNQRKITQFADSRTLCAKMTNDFCVWFGAVKYYVTNNCHVKIFSHDFPR